MAITQSVKITDNQNRVVECSIDGDTHILTIKRTAEDGSVDIDMSGDQLTLWNKASLIQQCINVLNSLQNASQQ